MKAVNSCTVSRTILWGAVFGAVTAYGGTYLDHIFDTSATPGLMYARSARYFWLTIPSLPGEAIALLTTTRDWMWDDAWQTYRHLIALWNIIFWAGAFPIFSSLGAFILSRFQRSPHKT